MHTTITNVIVVCINNENFIKYCWPAYTVEMAKQRTILQVASQQHREII